MFSYDVVYTKHDIIFLFPVIAIRWLTEWQSPTLQIRPV